LPLAESWGQSQSNLIRRSIGSKTETLPLVGLGTWETFDVTQSQHALLADLKEVLRVFSEQGATVVDSSPMYGYSEQNVGTISTELKTNSKLFIATKVWTQGKEKGVEQMTRSMQLLKRKQIDLMQVHNLVDWQIHLKTLREWKEAGKVRYIGITHYLEAAYAEMEKIMKSEPLDFIQINYNLADRQAERVLALAQEKKLGVLINQPFGYGKLFQQVKDRKLPAWAAEIRCATWAQFFLKFIISNPAVTCVIPGTANPKHVLDNLGAAMGPLPDQKQREKMIAELN
ncbi:MAG: aldo/keto reductase, partial [Bacteroidota bacterium]